MSSLCNFVSFLPSKPSGVSKTPSSLYPLPVRFPCCRLGYPSTTTYGHSSCDLKSLAWPSLTYATTLCFASRARQRREEAVKILVPSSRKYNVQYNVRDDDTEESLLRGFRSKVMKAGIMRECRRRMSFETKQEKKKRKAKQSARRNRPRHHPPKAKRSVKKKESRKRKDLDEEEDNWELPEGGIPY